VVVPVLDVVDGLGGLGVVLPGDDLGVGEASAEGDGELVPARAAVPLTRTIPVPTPMTSGFRTDRASTAHNLLNDRLLC
jgi:hypothetical protein